MTPIRESLALQVDGPPMRINSPMRTWMEVVKISLKKYNLSDDLAKDRLGWRNRTHVADPTIIGIRF